MFVALRDIHLAIDRRLRLLPIGLNAFQRAYPEKDQFAWHVSPEFRPHISNDEEQELKIVHLVHSGGSFCSAGDAGKK